MQARITKRTVDAAAPGCRDQFLWDLDVRGFGLKVTPAGRKVYVMQYRPAGGRRAPTRRYTIGLHGAPWTPEQAHREAIRLLAEVRRGGDPEASKQADRAAPTVADLGERFMAEHVLAKRRPRTADEYQRLIKQEIVPALGRRLVKDLTRAEVEKMHHDRRSTPYQANRALAVLSKVMNWAEKLGLRPDGSNPCRHVERFAEHKRERFLSPLELARLGRALAAGERCGRLSPYQAAAIRLLIFTGARLSEILEARWEWLIPALRCFDSPQL